MCRYDYQFHGKCEHRTIKLSIVCQTVYFAAGLTPGLMVPCQESIYTHLLVNMLSGKPSDVKEELTNWRFWEGYCEVCVITRDIEQESFHETSTDVTLPMAKFLPSYQDFIDWQTLMKGQPQPPHIENIRRQFLATIQHPWNVFSPITINWYKMLGVEEEVESEAKETTPMVHFEGLTDIYDPARFHKAWILNGKMSIGGTFLVGLLDLKDWYLIRNKGITIGDRIFIKESLRQNQSLKIIYKQRFQPRGMTWDFFVERANSKEIPDGPNPEQDKENLEKFNHNLQSSFDGPDSAEFMTHLPTTSGLLGLEEFLD